MERLSLQEIGSEGEVHGKHAMQRGKNRGGGGGGGWGGCGFKKTCKLHHLDRIDVIKGFRQKSKWSEGHENIRSSDRI